MMRTEGAAPEMPVDARISATVIVFSRVPVPGKVKTRLGTALPLEECAALQEALALDTVEKLSTSARRLVLCYSDEAAGVSGGEERLRCFLDGVAEACDPGCDLVLEAQVGMQLGERMRNALEFHLAAGAGSCILVGSDIPLMAGADVRAAADALSSNDVVLGPGFDDGYWLVGCKAPFPELFCGKHYGDGDVVGDAVATCQANGRSVALLSRMLDVDMPADLELLRDYVRVGDGRLGRRTVAAVSRLMTCLR